MVTWTVASLQRTPVVYCVRLARALVDDYCCLVPGSVQTLKQIFSASPRFCCQFITSVTALYDLSSGKLQTGGCQVYFCQPAGTWVFCSLKCVAYFRPKAEGVGHLDFWNLPVGTSP